MIEPQAFDALASSANGISKLRELILELAVCGLLVPQDPNDESVHEILKINDNTRAEVAKNDHRADHESQKIISDNDFWSIPTSWQWRGLADLTLFIDYRGKTPNKINQGVKLITAKNVKRGIINTEPEEFISELEFKTWMTRGLPKANDILFTTEAPMGNAAKVTFSESFALAQRVICLHPYHAIYPDFLVLQLLSSQFQNVLDKSSTGMTAKGIKAAKLKRLPIAIPPYNEQSRIVAKVDELMTLCDQLDRRQNHSNTAHQRLLQTLLETLTQAVDNEAFQKIWSQISANFDTLFITEDSIDQLKQVILQLAVMGKLVAQDLNDEPASELLAKIRDWQKEAVQQKQIRLPRKPLNLIDNSETFYKLPKGWVWTRLGEIIYIQSGDGLTAAMMENGQFPVFGGNGINGFHNAYNVDEKTIVIGRVGYYCGSIHLTPSHAWVTDNAFITKFCPNAIFRDFLFILLQGTNLKENENATAQPVISGSKIYPLVIGFPPLAEQHRIVAKVNELMSICDLLKSRISKSQKIQENLATAIVEKAAA